MPAPGGGSPPSAYGHWRNSSHLRPSSSLLRHMRRESKGVITAASTSISWTPGSLWGITDTGTGRLSFSVQTNTNYFQVTCHPGSAPSGQISCVPGHTGWVQFAYQYDSGWNGLFGYSALCVWNVDITTQSYPNSCVGVPGLGYWDTGTGPYGVLTIMGGESGQNVWTMGCLPWVSGAPQCWSVTAFDVFRFYLGESLTKRV